MTTNFEKFKQLHYANELLILPNAWDAKSAQTLQELQFPAIATSSMAVANSLGYDDGEVMPLKDYLFVIKRILSLLQTPLTVDFEMGYGNSDKQVADNILMLAELGVAGINLEDSSIANTVRSLKDENAFAKTIEHAKSSLTKKGFELFLNVRCDTYLLNIKNKQQETRKRIKLYESSGADGIFLPCICEQQDISDAVNHTSLPLNVMCIPGLPDLDELQQLGVKRLSAGPFLFNKVYSSIANLTNKIKEDKSIATLL
ncbi:MAG: isocitrate lyase/phosphoenolpyruvate mutase family protein [Chitinophagaceae bacterium]